MPLYWLVSSFFRRETEPQPVPVEISQIKQHSREKPYLGRLESSCLGQGKIDQTASVADILGKIRSQHHRLLISKSTSKSI